MHVAAVPAQVTHLIDRAVQIARATRSVTCVIVPSDLQEDEAAEPPRVHGAVFSGGPVPKPRVLPHEPDLVRAAEVLNAGERVAILIGRAPARPPPRSSSSRCAWAPASRRRSTAATCCPTTCPM